jgi:hypothetical protein
MVKSWSRSKARPESMGSVIKRLIFAFRSKRFTTSVATPLRCTFIRSEYRRRQGMSGSNKDVQIINGQKYIATTAFPQKVSGQATIEADPPIPNDALAGDKG